MSTIADIYRNMDYGPAPESAGYVREWLAALPQPTQLYIGGEWSAAGGSESIVSRNPASGETLATLACADSADVDRAVEAARAAFPAWSASSGHERARVLYALARLIQKNSRFLAVLETLDNGKPIRETRDIDVPLAARHFYHHAGWAQLCATEFPGHEPLGAVGQIIPWNFPLLMLAWKIAPAIAAGNTVVLKPAEYTSLSALYFAGLCREAGVPAGVVNIVTGAGETGERIVGHAGLAKIAFTGSTEVGRIIRRQTAGSGKKLSLELGGKSPFIVFEDADLDGAVEGLVDAIFFNQGEVCCAGSRLLAEESIYERLLEKIRVRLAQFRMGDPLDKAIDMGALADPVQKQRIDELVKRSVSEGAKLWQPDIECPADGCFYLPTLLSDVGTANTAMREEIFGPVLAAMPFRTLNEAVALANNTRYGLAASIWSENINRALEIAAQLQAGVVWVNTTNQFDAAVGFGGYRESGFGREGGAEGMIEYLHLRDEWQDAPAAPAAAAAKATVPAVSGIDRTPKHYIGGRQARPDGGNTRPVYAFDGTHAGRVADGNRKDIRNAVEAAWKASSWGRSTAHLRAQILYYIAENLDARRDEFAQRLSTLSGASEAAAEKEVAASISRLFSYGAWADKFDGLVHGAPVRGIALAVREPIGVLALVCPDELPLLGMISLLAPAVAMGNRVVLIPSERCPLPTTDFYQVLETSDVPGGVVNIVTGAREELSAVLAAHDQVEGMWYFGEAVGSASVERASADNMKRTWVNHGKGRDWWDARTGEGRQFLHEATQVKNIWLPYGD